MSREAIGLLGLLTIALWPVCLTVMFLLRKKFPPSNKRYAAFRSLAYVVIFWAGRTLGTYLGNQLASEKSIGAPQQKISILFFTLPLALIWIYVAYRLIERVSWKDLGWRISHLKREIGVGIALGVVLFLFRNFDMVFSAKPSLNFGLGDLVMMLVASFGVASWQEENIYRGYLQPKLEALLGKWPANVIQALLFSVAHIGYYHFTLTLSFFLNLASVAVMGFILGFYRQRYNSLVAPFIAHGLVDFLPIFWLF